MSASSAAAPRQRRIIHADMDAFYASVEQRDDPSLKGRPVAVGGSPEGRGVVAAASYEARAFGVRSALPMARAVRLCPDLVIVRPRFAAYKEVSDTIHAIFHRVTDLVEPLSLDEAYLDVTHNKRDEPSATRLAAWIKARVRAETGLTVSAGVAPNKFLAKIASDIDKPDGLTVITPGRVEPFLTDLPVRKLWGVGPRTAERLVAQGFERVGQLRERSQAELTALFGKLGGWLHELSHGRDDRPVTPHRERKSHGAERTFPQDIASLERLEGVLAALVDRVQRGLDAARLTGRTVTVKVRYSDFHTITRSRTLDAPLSSREGLGRAARALLRSTEAGRQPVRLLGVSVSGLLSHDEAARLRTPVQLWLPFTNEVAGYGSTK